MNAQNIDLTPAELKAVQEHKYYLSRQRGMEVSIDEAIADFLKRFAEDWRREKLRRDNEAQRREIDKHKFFRSMEERRDIGRHAAAEEWCAKYAPIWRQERESLERQGFLRITVVVATDHFHLRPASALVRLAKRFDCEIYVHKDGMAYYNFLLQGKSYLNVKSILTHLPIAVVNGDTVEFLLTGAQAEQAQREIEATVNREEA